ncbi:MAG: hypothetical protein ACR2KK_06390, partial [Acidimicrobiales bacterium]
MAISASWQASAAIGVVTGHPPAEGMETVVVAAQEGVQGDAVAVPGRLHQLRVRQLLRVEAFDSREGRRRALGEAELPDAHHRVALAQVGDPQQD